MRNGFGFIEVVLPVLLDWKNKYGQMWAESIVTVIEYILIGGSLLCWLVFPDPAITGL